VWKSCSGRGPEGPLMPSSLKAKDGEANVSIHEL
jgi:hypothetical protein